MVEKIVDMPAGTIGFRASGKLTPEDYRDVLVPTLREAVDAGEVRMLFVLANFEELEPRAWWEDVKTMAAISLLGVPLATRFPSVVSAVFRADADL
jgi:SpoIIAA-like